MVRKVFSKLKKRYQKWKEWSQYTWYGPIRRFLVLIGVEKNSYFDTFTVLEERTKTDG